MPKRRIDPRVEIGAVRLPAADLDRMLAFYSDLLGFEVTRRLGGAAVFLGAVGFRPLIILVAAGDGAAAPRRFALRYPDRAALADAFRAVSQGGVAVEQARDEGLREVLSVLDPEGNQVELYCDRPQDLWPLDENGSPRMASQPLDLELLRAYRPDAAVAESDDALETRASAPLSAGTRARLTDVRSRLLNLHKVLLDDAKTAYEMDRGRVGSNASLLQLVINDPWFAWLHPLSELVVRIDETLQPEAPATEADGILLLEQIERLLSPADTTEDFAQRYHEALQRQPAVIVAHAEVRRILKQAR